jgi:hypothetical protein
MTAKKGASYRPPQQVGGERRRRCPPHGPIMVGADEDGLYVASCLACGASGPKREDGWEAKTAFDEQFGSGGRVQP